MQCQIAQSQHGNTQVAARAAAKLLKGWATLSLPASDTACRHEPAARSGLPARHMLQ